MLFCWQQLSAMEGSWNNWLDTAKKYIFKADPITDWYLLFLFNSLTFYRWYHSLPRQNLYLCQLYRLAIRRMGPYDHNNAPFKIVVIRFSHFSKVVIRLMTRTPDASAPWYHLKFLRFIKCKFSNYDSTTLCGLFSVNQCPIIKKNWKNYIPMLVECVGKLYALNANANDCINARDVNEAKAVNKRRKNTWKNKWETRAKTHAKNLLSWNWVKAFINVIKLW